LYITLDYTYIYIYTYHTNIYIYIYIYRNVDKARVSQLEDRLQPVQGNAIVPISQFPAPSSAASEAPKVWWDETEDLRFGEYIYVLSISAAFQNDVLFIL
jgi:hypothetical protein